MTYRLIRFGTTNLEYSNQVDTIDSGATPAAYYVLPEGGAIDGFGSGAKRPGVVERVKQLTLSGKTEAAVSAQFYGLQALVGTRAALFRRTGAGALHWTSARLTELVASRDYQRAKYQWLQDLELHFSCQDAAWHGLYRGVWALNGGVLLDTGYALNTGERYALTASPMALSISGGLATDAGRAPIRVMKVYFAAGDAEMSNITIARTGGESLTYAGAVPSGGQLMIDTSLMRVTCTGVTDPYDNLTFTATANMAAWFTLQPGTNALTITYTGGGTGKAIEFIFNEAWY